MKVKTQKRRNSSMSFYTPWGYGYYGGYGGYGFGYSNGFILLVVLFVLLVIVGNNYPMGEGYGS
jgi:uncharacterized protein (TIGR01732 family)